MKFEQAGELIGAKRSEGWASFAGCSEMELRVHLGQDVDLASTDSGLVADRWRRLKALELLIPKFIERCQGSSRPKERETRRAREAFEALRSDAEILTTQRFELYFFERMGERKVSEPVEFMKRLESINHLMCQLEMIALENTSKPC